VIVLKSKSIYFFGPLNTILITSILTLIIYFLEMPLKIFYWNCGSGLLSKFDFMKAITLENNLDALFISEADVRSDFDLGCLSIIGYDLVLASTYLSRGKARLVCFKKHELGVFPLGSEFDNIIALKYDDLIIVGLYRCFKCYDNENERSNFERILGGLSNIDIRKEVVIIGDFNINIDNNNARFLNELTEWMDSKGLSVIECGTSRSRWVNNELQESTLDYVITNTSKCTLEKEITHLSDHYIMKAEISNYNSIIRERTIIELKRWGFDDKAANDFLGNQLRALPIMSCLDVEKTDYWIRACLLRTMNEFVKTKRVVLNNSNQVTSFKIIKLKNWKGYLRKKWLKEKTALNWVNFVRACRKLKLEVKKVRRNVLLSQINKGSKEFWGEIKRLRGVTEKGVGEIISEGISISNKKVISNLFVKFFTEKVNKLLVNYTPLKWGERSNNLSVVNTTLFTENDTLEALNRLSNKKSTGMDNLSGFFVKRFTLTLLPYLTHLFNLILKSGIIPETWKIAKIIPVHKKGNRTSISNYRPVSNLPSIAKAFELCILSKIEALDQDKIHSCSQHGFRKNHGTQSALAEIVELISAARDAGNIVAVYSVDLTAAFDLLRKEILFDVLIEKGLSHDLIRVIYNYLTDRQGYVQIGENRSIVEDIKVGCIQGSILGPVLYNIYTSGIEDVVYPCKSVIYADDSYIIVSGKSPEELSRLLELTICNHFKYLENIGMICNLSKTELVVFGMDELEVRVGDSLIKSSECMKVLGVLVDNKLSWERHVEKVLSNCRSQLFSLRYLRKHLDIKETFKVMKSHIVSRITYCSPVWSGSLKFNLRAKLRSLYYHFIRVILRDFEFKLSRPVMLRISGMENLDTIFFKRSSVFIFKLIHNLEPTRLSIDLISRSYQNERHTGRLTFFDISTTRIGKISVLNKAKYITDNWNFDWLSMTPETFKKTLNNQCL